MTPSESDIDSDFNPNSNIAVKARITAKGLSKLIIPLANHGSTFLVVNQLKTNIDPSNPHAALAEPYVTPGGKALQYSYSLRLWLTGRKAKKWFIENNQGDRIGSDVKCKVEKSRFGSFGRECHFKILWADDENISILDEESWFEAIKPSKRLTSGGPWYTLKIGEKEWKFQGEEGFKKKIREDEEFKKAVLDTMDKVVIERNSDE
jgi:RecA/RadA recombinase